MAKTTRLPAKTNKKLLDTYQLVEDKIEQLQEYTNYEYKTNGIFRFNTSDDNEDIVNIPSEVSIMNLILAHAHVKNTVEVYNKSAHQIFNDKPHPAFLYQGKNPQHWIDDIEARIIIINHHDELTKLTRIKSQLDEFLTTEHKLDKVLKEVKDTFVNSIVKG